VNTIEVEALTEQHNYAVIRLPERKFPGVVVQGDSLSILVENLRRGVELLRDGRHEDGVGEITEALEVLEGVKRGYEAALSAHSIPRPY
jgi:predicted RNase H-like HicB family nuclease